MDKEKRKRGVVLITWFIQSLFIFAPAYLRGLSFSGPQIGILTSTIYIFPTLFYGPAGYLCDIIPPGKILGTGFLLFSLFSIILGFFKKFEIILLGYILGSIGIAFINISIDTIFYRSENGERDFSGYVTSGGIGMGIGYVIAGLLTGRAGFKTFFYILASISFISFIASIFSFREKGEIKKIKEKNFWAEKTFLMFLLSNFLHGLHFGAETSSLAIFLKESILITEYYIGLFLGVSIFFLSFTGLITRNLYERGIDGKTIYLVGLFISGVGNISMALSHTLTFATIFRLLHVAGDAFIFVGSRLVALHLFGTERIGKIWGTLRSSVALSAFVGALLSGILIQWEGARAPFITVGLTSILAIIFIPPGRVKIS